MSGNRAIVLSLSVRGADKLRADLEALGPAGEKALQRLDAASKQATGTTGGGGFVGLRTAVGQAGYQIQDFAVQVQGGTSALVALGQQGSQLLGVFGPAGAIAGAVLTVTTLGIQLLQGADSAKKAKEAAEALAKAYDMAGNAALTASQKTARLTQETYRAQIATLTTKRGELVGELNSLQADASYLAQGGAPNANARRGTIRAGSLGIADRQQAPGDATALSTITTAGEDLQRRIEKASEALGKLETEAQQAQRAIDAGLDPKSIDRSFSSFQSALDKRTEILEKYRQTVTGIQIAAEREGKSQADVDKLVALAAKERDEAIGKLTADTKGASAVRRDALRQERDELSLTLRMYQAAKLDPRTGLLALTTSDEKAFSEASRVINASVLNPDKQEKANAEAKRRADQLEQAQTSQAQRITDNIVDYSANAFSDLFSANSRGWKGMLETFESTAKATFARIAAEAILRPIIAPIVGSVLGTGDVSAATSAVSAFGGGGSSFGSLGSLFSVGGSLASVGKLFGFAGSAPTAASVATGSVSSAVQGTTFLGLSGTGAYLGGAGAGFGGGMLASSLLGGNKTGGMIGSGLGAGAGLLIGGPVGGAIGGTLGGALGGLFGNSKPSDKTGTYTNNLTTGIGTEGGLEGKKFSQENRDAAKKISDTISGVAEQLRSALGVSSTALAYQVAVGGRDGLSLQYGDGQKFSYDASDSGTSALVKQAAEDIVKSMASAASADIQKIIGKSDDADALVSNISFYSGTYKTLTAEIDSNQTALDRYTASIAAVKKPYEDATAQAIKLGLETGKLAENQEKAVAAAVKAQAATYDQARRTAQGRDYITTLEGARTYYNDNAGLMGSLGRDAEGLFNDQAISILNGLDASQLEDAARSFTGWDDAVASLARQTLVNVRATEAATAAQEAAADAQSNQLSALQKLGSQSSVLTGFLNDTALNDATLSPQAKLAAAQSQFQAALDAARQAGPLNADLSAVTTAGKSVIDAGLQNYASSPQQAALTRMVNQTVSGLGADLGIPAFTDNLDRSIEVAMQQLTAVKDTNSQIAQLREEFRTLGTRMLAAVGRT